MKFIIERKDIIPKKDKRNNAKWVHNEGVVTKREPFILSP